MLHVFIDASVRPGVKIGAQAVILDDGDGLVLPDDLEVETMILESTSSTIAELELAYKVLVSLRTREEKRRSLSTQTAKLSKNFTP